MTEAARLDLVAERFEASAFAAAATHFDVARNVPSARGHCEAPGLRSTVSGLWSGIWHLRTLAPSHAPRTSHLARRTFLIPIGRLS